MSEAQADTIVILSSELIARITQEYFNKTMFKQKVEIVDLKPHGENGYAFSVSFVPPVVKTLISVKTQQFTEDRDQKGRFVKHG